MPGRSDRLGQVVVGTRIERLDPFAHIVARSQHQHRHRQVGLAQAAADLNPAEVGQGPVEQHQVPGLAADQGQGLLAAAGLVAAVPLKRELAAQKAAQLGIVVDDQHPLAVGLLRHGVRLSRQIGLGLGSQQAGLPVSWYWRCGHA